MAIFGQKSNLPKAAKQMQERNADLQERLYHNISEGLLNRGGPDYAGPVDYYTDIPIQSPLQQVSEAVGASLGLADKSGSIRDMYQNLLMSGGIGGLLSGLGFNTSHESFGGLPGFFSSGGLMGGGAPSQYTIPGGAASLTGGQAPVAMQSGQSGSGQNIQDIIGPALQAQGGQNYAEDPYFQGTQAMQNLRTQQQDQAQSVGNQLLGLVGLAQQPGIGFTDILGQVGNLLNQYDPYQFQKGQELLTGTKPLDLRQAQQEVQEYAPLMGAPMAQVLPGAAGAGQGGSQAQDILALGSLGLGLADEFGLMQKLRESFNAPQAPQAPPMLTSPDYVAGGGFHNPAPIGNAISGAGTGFAIGGPAGAAIGGGLGLLGGLL